MDLRILLTLYYTYPPSLCIALMVSYLILFRRNEAHIETSSDIKKRVFFHLIWYLQFFLSGSLLASIIIAAYESARTLNYQAGDRVVEARLASNIAVFLYFAAGLLPDPDGPFRPNKSNLHSWVVAIAFQIAVLACNHHATSHRKGFARLEALDTALRSIEALLLALMSLLFTNTERRVFPIEESSGDESVNLIGRSNQNYGGVNGTTNDIASSKLVDAQSTGWLDYFISFRVLFPYIWPSTSRLQQVITIVCFLLLVCQRIVNVLVPYQLGVLVESLGAGTMPYEQIALYCLYRGLQGQQGVLGSIRAMLWIPISQSLYRRLTCAAFEHVLSLSMDFHLNKRIGEVMSALNKGGALNTFLDGFAFQLFPMVFDLWVAAVYFFIKFDAFYAIIVIGVMWSYIFVTIYMAKYRGRSRREMAKRDREMDAAKTDAIMSYETVHHNCAVPSEASKFQTLVNNFQAAEFSVLFSLNMLNAIQNFIFIVGVILVAVLCSYQISIGLHKVAVFVSLLAYFAQLQAPLAFFGSFYNQVQNNLVDAERMLDLVRSSSSHGVAFVDSLQFKKAPSVVDGPNAVQLPCCTGRVTFSKVDFAYNPLKPALKKVSFTVEPGTSTAIVGESGSGKSTCLKLLFRFYDVDAGGIFVDHRDIRNTTISSLRQHIGVVPQDTILFNETLMYNLLYAKPDASCNEVFEACRAASIHKKILTFPDKYDTAVGERGLRLSGGERQRIAIARAILKRPQIMLLDEATASLDSHTEKHIQSALGNVTKGRTTIIIAHRLSTITEADQILVLHEGEIAERGTHSELLALGGRYQAMWERQTTAEQAKVESALEDIKTC